MQCQLIKSHSLGIAYQSLGIAYLSQDLPLLGDSLPFPKERFSKWIEYCSLGITYYSQRIAYCSLGIAYHSLWIAYHFLGIACCSWEFYAVSKHDNKSYRRNWPAPGTRQSFINNTPNHDYKTGTLVKEQKVQTRRLAQDYNFKTA